MQNSTQQDFASTNLRKFKSELSFSNKLLRMVWGIVWVCLFRTSPRLAFGWRRFILRLFGATLEKGTRIYPSTRVFYPPNLIMKEDAILGPDVDCYCVAPITLEPSSMVSQYSYLCAATHDYTQLHLPLISKPIVIESRAWVCADVFVGPGVTVGEGAVVGARSTVFKDVPSWKVVVGNPPKVIRDRVFQEPRE